MTASAPRPNEARASEVEVTFVVGGVRKVARIPAARRLLIGRSEQCQVVVDDPEASRRAWAVEALENRRIRIWCGQRFGGVIVHRTNGTAVAWLQNGEALDLPPGMYDVEIRKSNETLLLLSVDTADAAGSARAIRPGKQTLGAWKLSEVMNPTPKDEWKLVAVLAFLATRYSRHGACRPAATLQLCIDAWTDRAHRPGGWLSRRLQKAADRLGLDPREHEGKVPMIADSIGRIGVLTDGEIATLERELRSRAANVLTAEELRQSGIEATVPYRVSGTGR